MKKTKITLSAFLVIGLAGLLTLLWINNWNTQQEISAQQAQYHQSTQLKPRGKAFMKLKQYKDEKPQFDFKRLFASSLKGYGLIQDFKNKVRTRFDVVIEGEWNGNQGVVEENFSFYDGTHLRRIWNFEIFDDGRIEGKASDVNGTAIGYVSGNALNLRYSINIPIDGKPVRFQADDWLWQLNDGKVINRSYLKKLGITLAELTMFVEEVTE